jgi:hypothetical protein
VRTAWSLVASKNELAQGCHNAAMKRRMQREDRHIHGSYMILGLDQDAMSLFRVLAKVHWKVHDADACQRRLELLPMMRTVW